MTIGAGEKPAWRILVVDDEPSIHGVVERLFRDARFQVRSALSVPEAMALLKLEWDLFLFDKNLPDGNGVDLARAARAEHPEAVIIMMTGYATRESAEALVGIADDYVSKPFDLMALRDTATSLLSFREVGRKARAMTPRETRAVSLDARPVQSSPSPPPSARPNTRVHILVSDLRDEAVLLAASRQAGVHASSGPLAEGAEPDVLVVDAKADSPELRQRVWMMHGVSPGFRVVLVADGATLTDATRALALKASERLLRPLSAESAAVVLKKLKRD